MLFGVRRWFLSVAQCQRRSRDATCKMCGQWEGAKSAVCSSL